MASSVIQTKAAKLYVVVVLFVTWLVTALLFIKPAVGLKWYPVIMAIPAGVAILFVKIQRKKFHPIIKGTNAKALLFGIGFPAAVIILCALLSRLAGIGKLNASQAIDVALAIKMIVMIIINLVVVLGEEYGWRGYLLPALTKQMGKLKATVVVGIVWALFHVPAIYCLAQANGIGHPWLLVAVQAGGVFVFNFVFSYCYYLSGSLLPVLLFHSVWNVLNTTVNGDIYTNKPGLMEGRLLLMNGEGVMGLILGLLAMGAFILIFRSDGRKGKATGANMGL
ncbi:CPBP family intramembrane glutamic endopeptidase [Paenibacillus sp. MMS18-CY102]|uniref:CPBP family intramembrane glutamic endopeptidase n=1 Tax=Paenibacillus sp. MMS18-CY102 TaxID=2682849 RepID=UPI001F23933F|nr:CPBP family intramembrane glutamic endopeptidase [Paenibacillus sp. MMS18-CY102]